MQKGKILVIDDNTNLLEEISDALDFEGFHVVVANNGFDGVKLAELEDPDLILCDILMPEIDGFEVYRRLKENGSTQLIPFVYITALAEKNEIRKGMEIGADDYVIKPFSLEDLLKVINIRIQKYSGIKMHIKNKLNELQDNIIQVLPHELLTPMNGILGFSSLIKDDSESFTKSEIIEMATNIELCGYRLLDLIRKYQFYTTIVTKKTDMVMEVINTSGIIEDISVSIARRYKRNNDLDLKLEFACLKIGNDDFGFLIRELVDNAFKFSQPKTKVLIRSNSSAGKLEILIKDFGVGFPVENMSEISAFKQFNRKTQEQQGSGLGLITCMLVVQQYGGSLHIANANNGTEVKLVLVC